MPVPSLMAQQIRKHRHLAGWSQRELSRRCGIARSALAALECGCKHEFTVGSLLKVANALGVSVDALVRPDAPEPVGVEG